MKTKVFLGMSDIASQVSDLRKIFGEFGIQTLTAVHTKSSVVQFADVDVILDNEKKKFPLFKPRRISTRLKKKWDQRCERKLFSRAVKECDVFIFFWDTIFPDYADLQYLREKGKKIVFCFVGDDVRWYYGQKQEFNQYGFSGTEYGASYDYSVKGLERRLKYLRSGEKFGDLIFSRLDQAQLALRPYYRHHMMVDTKAIKPGAPQRKENPLVVHAPTQRDVKGSKYVIEAINKLKEEGLKFEYKLVENMPHAEALEVFRSADIIIDQLLIPGTGKLSSESLASGRVVISHMAFDSYPQNPGLDYPVIDASPSTICSVLKNVIEDYEMRKNFSATGRKFAEEVLDYRHFIKKTLRLIEGEKIPFDYVPEFFRKNFVPESAESIAVYNTWTETVKECSWYKEFVTPGSRAQLIF